MSLINASELSNAKSLLKSNKKTQETNPKIPLKNPQSLHQQLDFDSLMTTLSSPIDHSLSVLHCNIEQWLPLLPPSITPHTVFTEITKETARTMMECFLIFEEFQRNQKFHHKITEEKNETINQNDKNGGMENKEERVDLHKILPPSLSSALTVLEKSLSSQLSSLRSSSSLLSSEVFVKTSSRSAKNTVKERENFKSNYHKEFVRSYHLYKNEKKINNPNEDDSISDNELLNIKMISLVRSATEGLKFHVDNPNEILSVLCKSRRIYDDFDSALEFHHSNPTIPWVQNIVLREWIPFSPILEFRCFVHRGVMRAITQYTTAVFCPLILRKSGEIRRKIMEFWEGNVRDPLKNDPQNRYDSYVVDVGFIDPIGYSEEKNHFFSDEEYLKSLCLIELNPFFFTTHGGLFEWNNKEDNKILTQQDYIDDFPVFRYVKELGNNTIDGVDDEWKQFILHEQVETK